MVDLTPIVALLQSLGPWGWGAAAVLVMIQMRRNGGKSPTPAPTPNPLPSVPNLPAVDGLLDLLKERLKQRFPNFPIQSTGAVDGSAIGNTSASLAEQHAAATAAINQRTRQILGE